MRPGRVDFPASTLFTLADQSLPAPGACQVVCVNRLLILWLGRGSSAVDGVPVLAAVKLGRQVRLAVC